MLSKLLLLISGSVLFVVQSVSADYMSYNKCNWPDVKGMQPQYTAFNNPYQNWYIHLMNTVDNWYNATITCKEEKQALKHGINVFTGKYWLGKSQKHYAKKVKRNWKWVNDNKWNYFNWGNWGKYNMYGWGVGQQCGLHEYYKHSDWSWNDKVKFHKKYKHIAKQTKSVPEPGTISLFAIGLVALMMLPKRSRKINNR